MSFHTALNNLKFGVQDQKRSPNSISYISRAAKSHTDTAAQAPRQKHVRQRHYVLVGLSQVPSTGMREDPHSQYPSKTKAFQTLIQWTGEAKYETKRHSFYYDYQMDKVGQEVRHWRHSISCYKAEKRKTKREPSLSWDNKNWGQMKVSK